MKNEFIIWGVPPGKTYEVILFSKAKTMYEAKKVSKILENEHECKNVRVQVLNLKNFDFVKEFTKA